MKYKVIPLTKALVASTLMMPAASEAAGNPASRQVQL